MKRSWLARLRRWTILTHRYLGITLSLIFIVWFVSGIAIIYGKQMPRLTPELRLERLPALDFGQTHLTPSAAATKAGAPLSRALLTTIMERPAYRLLTRDRGWITIFADTGEALPVIDGALARRIASQFMKLPESNMTDQGEITQPDQWTVADGMIRLMPMRKIAVSDTDHTELYISSKTGEVAVHTTRGSRALAWVGAIPHWFYFAALRRHDTAWRQAILWTSGFGCLTALAGIVVGILRFSPRGLYPVRGVRSRHIPYTGWTRWHYIAGIGFGVISLTWVFSGLLSMQPWDWTSVEGADFGAVNRALVGGSLNLDDFPLFDPAQLRETLTGSRIGAVKEIELLRLQGDAHYAARSNSLAPLLLAANDLKIRREPFSEQSIRERVNAADLGVPVLESELLTRYDNYYYSRDNEAPLPALRLKFGDTERTWLYVDPVMSRVVAGYDRRGRLERWIYHGLHSLDFSFWYYNRPLWDIGVILLSAGGITVSGIGMFLGLRRMARNVHARGVQGKIARG